MASWKATGKWRAYRTCKRPMAPRRITRDDEEALIHGSMPDPGARSTKPSPILLRSLKSSATKGHLAPTFTLEATGTGKLSNANHQTVKWTPQVPTNTTWGDRLHFEWRHTVGNDGTVILTPHFTHHDYAADYEGNDALVSSAVEINKSYLFAIHLLRLAGHKVPTPTPVKPPTAAVKPPTSNDVSSSDDDSSDDEGADVIVTVRPRRATKPQGPTAKPASKPFGWGPAPRPRHTFTAKVDYGCQLYSGNNRPLPFLHAVPGASCGDLLELAVVWQVSSDGTHTQVAKLLRHHPAAACWQLGLVADSVAAVKQVVRAASFSW